MARKRKAGQPASPGGKGHNGGPPLDDEPREKKHVPEWGTGGIGTFFWWKKAHRAAWRSPSRDTQLWRLAKAEALGLTHDEYVLELLERGRYLQADDADRIAAIKAARKGRKRPRKA
jgi:hypothetical protein